MNLPELLSKLQSVKPGKQGEVFALCPAHPDRKTRSLHITELPDRLLLKCFAGCSPEAICQTLGITMADLFTINPENRIEKRIVDTYDYEDEERNLLYQVVRYEPKAFVQRHKNGDGEWVYNMDGVRRVLYHLPEIVIATDTIYLVEGEKDADTLWQWGQVATTSPGGANNWKPEFALFLAGKKVVIIPDNDPAGMAYARSVVKSLQGKVQSLACVLLPSGKDISEWLEQGNDIATLPALEQAITALEATYNFSNKGSRFLFNWGILQCEVSRIRSLRGATSCQLIFQTNGEHLLRTKFNLESSRVRSELAKELTARYKDADWKNILEELSNRTLEEFEKGDPVIKITSIDDTEELKYLLYPIAPLGKPTVIFGDPGTGKSQLAVVFTILTSFDWQDNPMRIGTLGKFMKGLLLDYEGDEDDARRQLRAFTEGMDLGYSELLYRRCSLPIADDLENIRAYIEDVQANYIIVDSVSLAAGGDLNHMDIATSYLRTLRQLNITSISLAHTSKDRESKSKTILGSVLFEAGARSVWEIRAQEDEDSLDIALFHRKSNLSKKFSPLGFKISYTPTGNTIEWHDPKSVEEFVERMGTNQRVIQLLKDHPASDKDIVDTLGITQGNWRVTKSRLKRKNIITEINGCNALVTPFL